MEKDDEEDDPDGRWLSEFNGACNVQSPIDLNMGKMTSKTLSSLVWCNYAVFPKKMKLTNTGKTVVLSAKWRDDEIPFIAGGPFLTRQLFSQIHFHWGLNDMEGSDHYVDGGSQPMELHAVHFNSNYTKHEVAMHKPDGISIVVYLFKSMENPKISPIVKNLNSIKKAETSSRIFPSPIDRLLRSFVDDYFLYRGSISVVNYHHNVTWLISREPIGISTEQVSEFRALKSQNLELVKQKKSPILTETENPMVYHVNPSGSMYSSLLPISRSLLPPRKNNCGEYFEEKDCTEKSNF